MVALPGVTFASVLFSFQVVILALYAGFVNYTGNKNFPVVDSRYYHPGKYNNYTTIQIYKMGERKSL